MGSHDLNSISEVKTKRLVRGSERYQIFPI